MDMYYCFASFDIEQEERIKARMQLIAENDEEIRQLQYKMTLSDYAPSVDRMINRIRYLHQQTERINAGKSNGFRRLPLDSQEWRRP